jgi:hypothetical protein
LLIIQFLPHSFYCGGVAQSLFTIVFFCTAG